MNNSMTLKYSLYFSLYETKIIIFLLNNKNNIETYCEFERNQLDKQLIIVISKLLNSCDINLSNIDKIYLRNIHGTWNANRLITLFAKTISFFTNISIYLDNGQEEIYDKDNSIKKEQIYLINNLKFFNVSNKVENITPYYNKCPIINT